MAAAVPGPETDDSAVGRFSVDLTGLRVLVTGGSRGIGRALVDGFAAAGACVTVAARHGDECERAAREIRDRGQQAVGLAMHTGDPESVAAGVAGSVAAFGGLDVVINNAATGLAEPIGSLTSPAMGKSLSVNVQGPVLLVQEALPHLRRSPWPSVINVISEGARVAAPSWAIYAAGKAALLSFTRSLAAALGPEGIRVNALCPGPVATDMFASNSAEVRAQVAEQTALRRVAEPSEMVGPALFLASRAASFVTGEVLYANGGSSGR